MADEKRIPSGSKIPPFFTPVEVVEIGNPGQPTELIVHNGKLYVYNPQGQTLIDGGIIMTQGVAVGLKSWVHNIVFSATDQDTAAWAEGTIYFGDGSSTAINSGNTGNITVKTYLYYDGTSTLKKTTNPDFLSDTYILLATVEKAATAGEKAIVTVSRLPSGTISADQIVAGYLNFDRAKGGTLQLGGSGNAYGVFSLKDTSDVEKIKMNKDGMEIYDGKIIIKNQGATAFIDSYGLISTANFYSGEVIATNFVTTTSTSKVDMPNMSLSFSLPRANVKVLFMAIMIGRNWDFDTAGGSISVVFDIDGNDTTTSPLTGIDNAIFDHGVAVQVLTMFDLQTGLGSGSHTLKLQWSVSSGTTGEMMQRRLVYIILGQ